MRNWDSHAENHAKDLRGKRLAWGAVFLTICTTGVVAASYSYIAFAPTYLRETLGVSLAMSTVVLTIGTLLGIGSYIVFGTMPDRVGRRRATIYACLVGVAGFAPFALWGKGSPTVGVVALMGTRNWICRGSASCARRSPSSIRPVSGRSDRMPPTT